MEWWCYFLAIYLYLQATPALSEAADSQCPDRKIVVCYWASWAVYRPGFGGQQIADIRPEFCTHLVYSFAGLDIDGKIESLDTGLDLQNGGFKNVLALKEANPCLKVLLAIGGWGEGSEKYSLMASTEENRETFADSVLRFLIFYGFDGIDIDWEYPTQRGGLKPDKENFTKILKLLKKKLAPRNRIVTAAVSASLEMNKIAYYVKDICKELDYVSLMAYDFFSTNETSVHSPLRAEVGETRPTVSDTVDYYKKAGCPAEKIILGVPAYGRTYTLENVNNTGVGAPVAGLGKPGPYTGQSGFWGFYEICKMQAEQKGWTKVYLERNAAVYAYRDDAWVSYDDERTVVEKAEYVLEEGLGGMMIWSIDTDDFRGTCSNGVYPLLAAINKGLKFNVTLNA